MNRKKYVKTFINNKFFNFPCNILQSKITSFKLGYLNNKIELVKPFLFVCNKTSPFDLQLISNTMNGPCVFLKDWVIQDIYNGQFSDDDKTELLNSFKILKEAYISVVVFPEKNLTVLGKTSYLPIEITNLLNETKYDIKIIALVGAYFAKPIWSPVFRKCNSRFHHQFSISYDDRYNLNNREINEFINYYMPSSASTYSYKYDPMIRSNTKAQNLETVIYCCPHCKKFFTIYSEYNCLKCTSCGAAIECSSNGRLSLSKKITNFDELANFQFNSLKNIFFDDKKPMISYEKIKVFTSSESIQSLIEIGELPVAIYCNKIVISNENKQIKYKITDIKEIAYKEQNSLFITLNNNNQLVLQGLNKENLYIIYDLFEITKQIKTSI